MSTPATSGARAPLRLGRHAVALGAAALAAFLGGCTTIGDYVLGGEDHSEPPAELEAFEALVEVRELWSRRVGSGSDGQYLKLRPALGPERVFAAARDGEVRAFDRSTGELLWSTDTGLPVSGGPGAGGGLVLIGTSEGEVAALAADSGQLLWRSRVSSEVLSPPLADQGVVVARTGDGKIFGLSAGDGARLWVYDRTMPVLSLRGTSTPALAPGTVVAGFDSGRVVSLGLSDGAQLWDERIAIPSGRSELERMVDIDADPVIDGDTVYVATFQGHVSALDLTSGASVWRREMSTHQGLAVDPRNLYLTDESGHVWALDRSTSASLWRQQKLQARAVTGPALAGGYVVVGDFEGYVHWLRSADGQFAARARVDGGVMAAPVGAGNTVYVYDRSGDLTAFALK